ncbi:nitrogenase molybdenum-cofactor synthesis protein NifE [Anaerospora hongkongensis]|uniref:Nitrogenase molybdenum-cofactor synthesis protein NifE n=1 Tax=Anaerospora hongkongensis TaxID=244830 RepID=A0A4R1Q4W0_9FIRM|nr:nitrogenase component 1 [Anaerospora hongkongensis]TCL36561.1 nitrogenase molybdenum-cofactor synthesis protein NifE [Anaerospora hongkongensis]
MSDKTWSNVCTEANTCGLTGAAAFFAGIPDAVIVTNGPLWCYFYALRYLEKPCTELGSRFYCTQAENHAVVYGTEESLLKTLEQIRQNCQPSVILIENSCAIGLIGDDIEGIARQAAMPCPVVCIDSGGLKGGFWEGYRAAAKSYFTAMPLKPRRMALPWTINLIGCTVGYYNSENDLRELKRLLSLAGYQVLACPGAGSSTAEIACMAQAELNIVVHEELGLELAQFLQQVYGTPYVSLLPPYGMEGTVTWLKRIGEIMWLEEGRMQPVWQEVQELEQKIRVATLDAQRVWGDLWFESTLVAAPASVALAVAQAVRSEWADTGPVTVLSHSGSCACQPPAGIDQVLDGGCLGAGISKQLELLPGGLLLASSNEKALLQKAGITDVIFQPIALPVYDEINLSDRPLLGLRGACHMLEQLWNQYIHLCQRWR